MDRTIRGQMAALGEGRQSVAAADGIAVTVRPVMVGVHPSLATPKTASAPGSSAFPLPWWRLPDLGDRLDLHRSGLAPKWAATFP